MSTEPLFEWIRPSSLSSWADCQRRALHQTLAGESGSSRKRRGNKQDIRAWFGSAVHAVVAGEPLPMVPFGIAYNKLLPNEVAATSRAQESGSQILDYLEKSGVVITGREVQVEYKDWPTRGTVDLVGTRWGVPTIIDLKTGSYPVKSSWLQLTSYAQCMRNPADKDGYGRPPEQIGILRALMLKDVPEISLALMPADQFINEWYNLMVMVDDIRQPDGPMPIANPSSNLCASHCADTSCVWHPTNLEEENE